MVALLIALALCIPAVIYRDQLSLELALHRLSDRDPIVRSASLNHVMSRMNDTHAMDVIRRRLIDLDDAFFEMACDEMMEAGVWGTALGDAWARRVMNEADNLTTQQRRVSAGEAARLVWREASGHDAHHTRRLVQRLARDDAPSVRLAVLPAVGLLANRTPPDNLMRDLLSLAADHPNNEVNRRATILVELIDNPSASYPPAITPPATGLPPNDSHLEQLALLEDTGDAFTENPVDHTLPPLLLLQAVRTSTLALTDDLIPVIESNEADLPQLAALIASRRFDNTANNALALKLLNDFGTTEHVAGATLAALIQPDDALTEALTHRAELSPDWATRQMASLTTTLHGIVSVAAQATSGIDAAPNQPDIEALLADRALPRTAVILALANHGHLDGFDWLLNPIGVPPADLSVTLIDLRFKYAIDVYLPGAPRLDPWAPIETIHPDIERLRMWYLLNRSKLVFDQQDRVYRVHGEPPPATPSP